uniref:Ribosomal protein L2 n=1 Tax=Gloeochaete wittrockiana TaxID=38269 RepID=A0A096Y6V7_9EUKA|nr:ribosomal protein L2 [Gloeochaete wittrockiana]AIM52054.1 ribosomal protein L2 [Gloeochaete wittrockiana]
MEQILKNKTHKRLSVFKSNIAGRNQSGSITVRHRGGGNKKFVRILDYKRPLKETALVISIKKDPKRSAFIALIYYIFSNVISMIIAPKSLKQGDLVAESYLQLDHNINNKVEIAYLEGFSYFLSELPVGMVISSVSLNVTKRQIVSRAAGSYCVIIKQDVSNQESKLTFIKLPSHKIIKLNNMNKAVIGIVSNIDHNKYTLKKAGNSRWLGIRPTVRGVAMNPVDHAHGGRTKGGRPSVSPWGRLTKGKKTVNKIR